MTRRFRVLLLSIAFCITLFTAPAHAYIDPGSGSFFLQVALAALISSLVAVKMFWRNVKGFFSRKSRDSANNDDHDR